MYIPNCISYLRALYFFFCDQSHSEVDVRVDCRASRNCLSDRGDLDYIIKIGSHSTEVSFKVQKYLICHGQKTSVEEIPHYLIPLK